MSRSSDEIPIDVVRTDKILRFVRGHPECTKADVIRHMKGKSSINTTHYILLNLIDKGKLIKKETNPQTHLLTINEDDEFNKFHKMLINIQEIVDEMGNFIISNSTHSNDEKPKIKKKPKIKEILSGLDGIENSYRQLIDTILIIIYDRIMIGSSSEIFAGFDRILWNQLEAIHANNAYIPWDRGTLYKVILISGKNLETRFKEYNDQVKVKSNLGDSLIETLENFRKEILGREKRFFEE